MRLFIALDIESAIRERVSQFVDAVREFAPEARWVKPESLHVTLKFIGERPESTVEKIKQGIASIQAESPRIQFGGYGFFPSAKSPRVFWIGLKSGPELLSLAALIDDRLAALGMLKEARAFSPHLTLARTAGASGSPRRSKQDRPNAVFGQLQEKLLNFPEQEFGTMTPREFFLYQSQLSPKGSKYIKLAAFGLP